MRITFTNDSRISALTNFPALVILGTNITGFDYGDFTPTHADLRFADQTESKELNYEIEHWDTNGNSFVWVQVDILEPTTNIYVYWGKPHMKFPPVYTTNGATWSEGFTGVWHLNTERTPDSTAGRYNGINSGSTHVSGKIAGAQNFASPSFVTIPNGAFATISDQVTISLWQYGAASQPREGHIFEGAFAPPAKMLSSHLPWSNGNVYWDAFNSVRINKAASASEYKGQWNNWVFLRSGNDGGTMQMYLNGRLWHSGTGLGGTYTPVTSFKLGAGQDGGENYYGMIDEFRVSNVACSSNWIWACWANQESSQAFLSYGEIEGPPAIANSAATGITTNSAWLNGALASTGGAPTYVWSYWGPADGGNTNDNWVGTNYFGECSRGDDLATNITGLSAGVTYYYRYYATNTHGAKWASPSMSFTTLGRPKVDTMAATNVQYTSAWLNGDLVTNGLGIATVRVYWGTNDMYPATTGWAGSYTFEPDAEGLRTYQATGLVLYTAYVYRYYATNVCAGSWGTAAVFTTLGPPAIETLAATNVQTTGAWLNGNLVTNGYELATVRAYWGRTDMYPATTGWAGTNTFAPGAEGTRTCEATGLAEDTTYVYRYYATNLCAARWGTAVVFTTLGPPTIATLAATNVQTTSAWLNGNVVSAGGVPTTVRVYWQTNDVGQSHDGWCGTNDFGAGGNGARTIMATGLVVGTTYYCRYYATNTYGESWGDVVSFVPGRPWIATLPATLVQGTTAYLNGNLTAGGTATVIVYWAETDLYPAHAGWLGTYNFGTVGHGARSYYATTLISGRTYYYRYYATNSFGESWGDAVSFVPPALPWSPHPRVPPVTYTTPGTYFYEVPPGVRQLLAVAVGGGGAGGGTYGTSIYGNGGGGGGLRYSTNIVVTPGSMLTIVVGNGGFGSDYSGSPGGDSFINCDGVELLRAGGGKGGKWNETYGGGAGGGGTTLGGSVGGGNGGSGGSVYSYPGGGGGAGGYSGAGGYGGVSGGAGGDGVGGGAGGGGYYGGCGGGVDIFGEGVSGTGGSGSNPGNGGSGGMPGSAFVGGTYGGGGGGSPSGQGRAGAAGAVRILGWWTSSPATIEVR